MPRRLSENGYFPQSLCQAQIIILEILKCIPVVIIFAFLDLEKNSSFSDSLLVTKDSLDPEPFFSNEIFYFRQFFPCALYSRFDQFILP